MKAHSCSAHFKTLLCLHFLFFMLRPLYAQTTISGLILNKKNHEALPYLNLTLKKLPDSTFVTGSLSNEEGRFTLSKISPGNYVIELSYLGFKNKTYPLVVGSLSDFLDLGSITMEEDAQSLQEIEVLSKQDEVSSKMDKKVYNISENTSQTGGSVLQAMKNLPGVSIDEAGKVSIRGSEKVSVLVDGKQTALTGFDNQSGLDNIPASAIEKIEVINNPSAKYDANGNAGIINIVYKKNQASGLSGKAGLAVGLGALWIKKENYPTVQKQYQFTPKLNPSLSLNYRKKKVNVFFQGDYLYTETLNKNEFVDRTYTTGLILHQQTLRNRNTEFSTIRSGLDWQWKDNNLITVSGLWGREKILDHGDEAFFNADFSERIRFWQFLEDELKTTIMGSALYQHKFKQAGRVLNISYNYTFHRENEKYFFTNTLPSYVGSDAFKLLSDEQVSDFTLDHQRPFKFGKFESGAKFRRRSIPTNMQFIPGLNSPLDTNAGGWANYTETIPALYGNYSFENKRIELEAGLRLEYVNVKYDVNPGHNTYVSDGYTYQQPFPNLRFAYKINDKNRISCFYNRRVDRPGEVDIRIFPKYDDAEIIKVGNPALNPQFTNSFELGYKLFRKKAYLYSAVFHRITDGTIARIAAKVGNSPLIYSVMQNAGRSYNSGFECILSNEPIKWFSFNFSFTAYQTRIDSFTVQLKYPVSQTLGNVSQEMVSGNVKLNGNFHLSNDFDIQLALVYLAPDLIPQGKIDKRFSADLGLKKTFQKGKSELYLNASDLFNTMVIRKNIQGSDFSYISSDYYETQVIRVGYNYKF